MQSIFFVRFFKLIGLTSRTTPIAIGLRNCNAPFASAKKYASHFLSSASGVTEPKEAAYAVIPIAFGKK